MVGWVRRFVKWANQPFVRGYTFLRRKIERTSVLQRLSRQPLCKRLQHDPVFRSGVILAGSLIVNFAYGAIQLFVGIYARSVWLGALSVYHIFLAVMQFRISAHIRQGKSDIASELRQCRFCGILLLSMTPVFASILILVIHKNSQSTYPGILIYPVAVYTVVKVSIAVRNAIRYRKSNMPLLSAWKTTCLISDMVSALSLETAVLFRYGRLGDPSFYKGLLGTVGGTICLFTLVKSILMIICATRRMRILENGKQRDG